MLQVVDGHGRSKIAAAFFVYKEDGRNLKKVLDYFKATNPNHERVRSVMVDKDFAEINALKSTFPNISVVICLFHAMRAIRVKVDALKLSLEDRKECMQFAYKIRNARSLDSINEKMQDLFKTPNLKEFHDYMLDNWIANGKYKYWCKFVLNKVFTAGDTTNNRNESLHSKLKLILGSQYHKTSLTELYETIKEFFEWIEGNHMNKVN